MVSVHIAKIRGEKGQIYLFGSQQRCPDFGTRRSWWRFCWAKRICTTPGGRNIHPQSGHDACNWWEWAVSKLEVVRLDPDTDCNAPREWERAFSRQSVEEVGKLVFFNTVFQERLQVTVTDLNSLGAFVNQVIKGCLPVIRLFRHIMWSKFCFLA